MKETGVAGTSVVEFQPLLYGGDGTENRESVDSALDVRSRAILISQHPANSGYLVLGRDDQ